MRLSVGVACLLLLIGAAACRGPGRLVVPASEAAFDVPQLRGVTIDGSPADWGEDGFRVDVLTSPGERRETTRNFDAVVRLGWDAKGLLVLATVTDDVPFEHDKDDALWRGDSVELFVAPARGARDVWQAAIAPGLAPGHPKLRTHLYDYRKTESLKAAALTLDAARTDTADGYVLEARLPWRSLAIEPTAGREVAFQLFVTDADGPQDSAQLRWFPEPGAQRDTRRMHRLRLAGKPSSPVGAVASGSYERFRRTRIQVAATSGRQVRVLSGGQVLGDGRLAADGRLRTASVVLPMPPRGKPYGPLTVAVEGMAAATVVLPDADAQRKSAFERAEMNFKPCVFSGERFPRVEFAQPSLVEDIIGPHTLKTTFYGADYGKVTVPKKPGRYGAVVEIQPAGGPTTKRFFTLFRQPRGIRWWHHELKLTVELPPELGIAPAVVRSHSEAVADFVKWAMVGSFDRNADSAVVLAGLYETKPGTPPTDRTGPSARNNWWWHELKRRTGDLAPLRCLVHLPPGAGKDKTRRWPTILFLHGAGERGDDLKLVGIHGPPKIVKTRKDFPFIVISPQCPRGRWWSPPPLNDLLEEVMAKYPIDPERLYLTGLSMGGYGSWALSCEYPGRFAAVVPICGGGDPRDVARVKDVPIWVFHGGKDTVVPLKRSEDMVAGLRKIGGSIRFTVYPDADHNSWAATYDDPRLYDWLLQQRRGLPRQPRATTQGTRPDERGAPRR